jgi:DNA gyrase subunit A
MIPSSGPSAKGTHIVNILPVESGERVTAMIHVRDEDEDQFLVMITQNGTVKRLHRNAMKNIRATGIRALRLDEGDELISVRKTDGAQNILIATHDGYAICFSESDVRPMGREAVGVRGIRLRPGDYCVGASRARPGGALLTVTENGYGKRTDIQEYLRGGEDAGPQKRGGMGMKNYRLTKKTGKVADIKVVDETDDILLISDDGTIIRMAAGSIALYQRSTQGVRLMRPADGAKVISVARTDSEEEEEEEEENGEQGACE